MKADVTKTDANTASAAVDSEAGAQSARRETSGEKNNLLELARK